MILLIWRYLQLRHYLHESGIAFDDFDPMENLEKFFTHKPEAESNLNLLLSKIEHLTPEDNPKNNISIQEVQISNPAEENKELKRNDESHIFDTLFENANNTHNESIPSNILQNRTQEENKEPIKTDKSLVFDAPFKQVDTSPVLKRQKIAITETTTKPTPQKTEAGKTEYSLLKKRTKHLPPWLRKGN